MNCVDAGGAGEITVTVSTINLTTGAALAGSTNVFATGTGAITPPAGTVVPVTSSMVTNASTTTTHAITCPESSGTRAGHIGYVGMAPGGGSLSGSPSGWTLVDSEFGASNPRLHVFRRVLNGTATDDFSQATSSAVLSSLTYVVVSGASTTTPEDVTAASTGTTVVSASHVAPSLTTVTPGTLLLAFYAANSGSATFTPEAGMTELRDTAAGVSQMVAWEAIPAAGATGTRTATCTLSRAWAATTVAVRPA